MKHKLITLVAIGAFSLGSSAFAQAPQPDAPGGQAQRGRRGGDRHGSLEKITDQLNLTPQQKAKIQPILDQAKPQIENIRREAMEKTKAVMESAKAQIRPLLTPEQQKRLDEARDDRRGGREGRKGGQGGQGGQEDQGDEDPDGK